MIHGVLNVDKAAGMTSFDVVAILKRVSGQKKVGHTGTLDPLVTGVLPICFGQATRIAEYLTADGKTYRGRFALGYETDTLDTSGQVLFQSDRRLFPRSEVEAAFRHFTGPIRQKPPMYSSVKKEGKRLYELARQGIEVEREARPVTIYSLQLLDFDGQEGGFVCSCSKGTYIRQLLADIGRYLGTYATMTLLRRTRSGHFQEEDAFPIQDIKNWKREELSQALLPMDTCLPQFPRIILPAREGRLAANGVPLREGQWRDALEAPLEEGETLYRVYSQGDSRLLFIGLAFIDPDQKLRMKKVLLENPQGGGKHADH